MTLSVKLDFALTVAQAAAGNFGDGPIYRAQLAVLKMFGNGVGADQVDKFVMLERQVASATNDDIDLSGVLTGVMGETVTFARIIAVALVNAPKLDSAARNTTNLTVGGGSNPFLGFLGGTTPTLGPFRPGAGVVLWAPDSTGFGAVTNASNDILRIANSSGAAATYQLGIIGRSA
ncbi:MULTISPECIES: hypothetical protein [Methylosinus]|uniref:Uncharacterized protein n=1 Tax=Methylosinus trichosporium (strain ATCC 35070 / NCIMB 11131 / UNIQEM 75 / OB3b) TaxID=595536 RepID=A0A2D2CYC9_METT3|nr:MULTISPECIES: hypothetical protein [Methylosinus]ATQ67737.1 hypothetical protein CQW49_07405 [Methylosinus trichosporium OB3b]OBS51155.1 hypothetical protein A8B73_17705 [Methylosinus sp. 3S-1]